MPVIAISTAPARDTYERVREALDLEHRPAVGLVLHSAGELDTGEVRIVQVFDTASSMQTFQDERLLPAFVAAGVEMDRSRAPQPLEAFELITA